MERKKIRLNCKFVGFKNGTLNYKCKQYKKSCSKVVTESTKNFPTLHKFCYGDLNKFLLLLTKCIYPYEHIYIARKDLMKIQCSELNLENITDKDYEHVKKVWKAFEIKSLGGYHDLYVQYDTFLLADVFENFRNEYIEIYRLDIAHFLSAQGLAWQSCLKKTKVKLELLTDIYMLLIVEKGTRGGICQAIHRYAKANNKYMKSYNKDVISSHPMYLDANNLYGWAMSH